MREQWLAEFRAGARIRVLESCIDALPGGSELEIVEVDVETDAVAYYVVEGEDGGYVPDGDLGWFRDGSILWEFIK